MVQSNRPDKDIIRQIEDLKQDYDALKLAYNLELNERKSIEFDLRERLKELKCHNQISEMMANPTLSLTETIEKIVEIIPPSWQFQDIAQAQVVINEKSFQTPHFVKSKFFLRQPIKANNNSIGYAEVSYPEDKIDETVQVFLPEETDLLFSISVKIGNFVERIEKDSVILKNEEKFRSLIESIGEIIYEFTSEGIIEYISPSIHKVLGYLPQELIGKSIFNIIHEDDRLILAQRLASFELQINEIHEYRFFSKTGEIRWMRKSTTTLDRKEKHITRIGTLIDITEKKKSEEELIKANRLYAVISQVNQAIVHTKDRTQLLDEICNIAIEFGKFRMSWIGIVDEKTEKIVPLAIKGHEDNYLSLIKPISIAETPEGIGPTGRAMREGHYFVCNDIENDQAMAPWKEEALKRGYRSSISLPIKQSGKIKAAYTLYASTPNFFNHEEIKLLEEIAGDIGFSLDALDSERGRKIAEEEYRKFKTINEEANFGSALTTIDGYILYVNKAFAQMHQYEANELIGMHLSIFHNSEQMVEVEKSLKILAEKGEFSAIELWHSRKDGSVFPTLMNATTIFDDNHQPQYMSATAIEITELAQKEEALRLSEENLNYAQEIGSMGSWEHNLLTNEMTCSKNYYRQIGLQPGEHSNDLYSYFISLVHPDDLHVIKYLQTTDYKHNKTEVVEFRIILPDGNLHWLQNNVVPIFQNNKLVALKGVNIDITDRKKSDEEIRLFRTIIDQANYGSAVLSPDGIINYVNPEFTRLLQYTNEELVDKSIFLIPPPEQFNSVTQKFETVINMGEFSGRELWFTRKDGSRFPAMASNIIIYNYRQEPLIISVSLIDITELKQKEKALIEREDELNYAQEIANMGSWDLDLRTNKVRWSKNNYKLMESPFKEGDEVSNDYFISLIHPDDLPLLDEKMQEMRQTRQEVKFDLRLIMPSGTLKWIHDRVAPIFEGENLIALRGANLDITEKKLVEEEIKQRNDRLNAIVSAIPDLMFVLDSSGTNLEFYARNTDKLLAPVDKFIGTNVKDLFDASTAQLHLQKLNECITTKDLVSYEYSIGDVKSPEFFEARLAPLDGQKVLTFIRDITDKRRTEIQIRKLSQAIEQSPVIVVITGINGNIEYVNPAFSAISGYSYEEAIGQNPRILQSGKTDPAIYQQLWNSIRQGKQWQGEWINKKKNGELYWESVVITPIQNELNEITNYLAVKQDITERKETEEKIRELNASLEKKIEERTAQLAEINLNLKNEIEDRKAISEALQIKTTELENFFSVALDLLCIADTTGNFIRVNKAWESILGYSTTELEKRKFLEFVHPDDIHATLDTLAELSEQHPILNFTNRYLTKDGDYRFIEWRSSPSGNLIYAAARDITERIKSEEATRKAQKEAELANMAKSEFLSRMSHELRTPMNAILGFAQLLEMGQLNPSQRKGVDHILRGGKHLLDLINEVLDISRIESGRLSLSTEPVRLYEVLEEMIDTVGPLAETHKVNIQLIESPSNYSFVKADRQRLKQVMLNLINNSIKYNHSGGKVNISTQIIKTNDKPTVTRIAVSDTGPGISPDDLHKLFTPFERIGAEYSKIEGSGLGLAVVKKFVEAMNGIVGVESEPGSGSTFWVELPHTESQLKLIGDSALQNSADKSITVKKGTVLCIEDNSSNIELIEHILESQRPNIRLISNTNGRQVISMCIDHKPDLILLDLNLPDIHGSEVIKILQNNTETKNIPVVVVSADAMPQQLNSLIQSGAKKYLTKPLDIKEFLMTIDEFCCK